ncbi:MAG: indole-3-glycerol phosphate synthase TrpC [candidate division FCPU426 bacterium]
MAKSFLKAVMKEKHKEVAQAQKRTPLDKLLQTVLTLPPVRNFREALANAPRINVVAEIKRRMPGSPSFRPRYGLEKMVAAYVAGGAVALSYVTDAKHFDGKLGQIAELKRLCGLPVLRKDFVVDPYQIYESRAAQADAVLLIAEALPDKLLTRLVELTIGLGMTPVVEIHKAPDVKRSLRAGADVILINNRDLNTLKINRQTVGRLAKSIPRDNLVIAASGYATPEEITTIESDRVRSVLVGRALLADSQPETLLRRMVQVAERL